MNGEDLIEKLEEVVIGDGAAETEITYRDILTWLARLGFQEAAQALDTEQVLK